MSRVKLCQQLLDLAGTTQIAFIDEDQYQAESAMKAASLHHGSVLLVFPRCFGSAWRK